MRKYLVIIILIFVSGLYWFLSSKNKLVDKQVTFPEESEPEQNFNKVKAKIKPLSGVVSPLENEEGSTEYIVDCGSVDDKLFDEYDDLVDIKKVLNSWKNNPSTITQAAYFMVLPDENNDLTLVKKYIDSLNSGLEKKALSYFYLSQCSLNNNLKACASSDIDEIIAQNQNNGASWFVKASIDILNNDTESAIESLRNTVAAPIYDEQWGNFILLFDLAYQQIGIADKRARIFAAIGTSAAVVLPSISKIFDFCNENSKKRIDIGYLCSSIGEKLFRESKTLILQGIGLQLLESTYSVIDDQFEIENIKKQREKFNSGNWFSNKAFNLAYFDDELLDYWYDSLLNFPEDKAVIRLHKEAIRKSKNPLYNPCQLN